MPTEETNELIRKRKEEHIKLSLKKENQYLKKTTGFECIELIHNALPNLNFDDIDTHINIFNRIFDYPIYISGMTGGIEFGKRVNMKLAELAEKYNIPFGVGSQKPMLKDPNLKHTYDVKREYPSIFLIGNIGAVQLKEMSDNEIDSLIKDINADALAIHINPGQEIMQHEGDLNFENSIDAIKRAKDILDVPVIVKEVGTGINREIAKQLEKIGISYLDVAGSGGTNWLKIDMDRGIKRPNFYEWGIPTALCLLITQDINIHILASGGIRSGVDGAKSLVLGADMFGAAKPFLEHMMNNTLEKLMNDLISDLKTTMFLTGSKNIKELKRKKYILFGWLKEWFESYPL